MSLNNSNTHDPRGRRRARHMVVALAAALLLSVFQAASPANAAGTRFHEQVFSSVDYWPDLQYGTATDYLGRTVSLQLDLYQPAGDSSTDRPVVVLVHGGDWSNGSRRGAAEVQDAMRFARMGYVAVSVDYRLQPAHSFDWRKWSNPTTRSVMADAEADVSAAISWLKANSSRWGIDPAQISLVGRGSGATTAFAAAADNAAVDGVVSISGAASREGIKTSADATVIHGRSDSHIPVGMARKTCEQLRTRGASCSLSLMRGNPDDSRKLPEIVDQAVASSLGL